MRFRNLKGKEEIIDECKYIVKDPNKYKCKWNKVFQNNNPIYIEIGIGLGKFIKENALKYPDINFIGIEKQDNALARAIKNYEEDIPNLKLISVVVDKELRYKRVAERPDRPFDRDAIVYRDLSEIENLFKGGPIAFADYYIFNNGTVEEYHKRLDEILESIGE